MKLRKTLLFGFIVMQFESFSQEYIVSMEVRNKTIELTNQAINSIKENKPDDAYSFLTKAISIDSTFRPSFLYLYNVFLQNKDYSGKVVFYYKKAQGIFLKDDEIAYYLGEIYRINGDLKNAMLEYSSSINFSKMNGEDFPLVNSYYFNRGNCYLKMNLIDSAIVDYNYSIKLNSNHPSALLNRGICHFKKGNLKEACEDWKKSLILGNSSSKEYLEKYCKQ